MAPPVGMPDSSPEIFCPECGAPAPFRGTAVSLVCEYCTSTVVRTGVDVKLVGKISAIHDNGSPVLLGSQGTHGQRFEVVGRLQVSYDRGYWNEWYLEFADGSYGWMSDAQGQYSIMRPKDDSWVPDSVPKKIKTFTAGGVLSLHGVDYVVVDRRAAEYQGAEGLLPFEAETGMRFYSVDFRGYDGEFLTLDYGNEAYGVPQAYLGRAVRLDEIKLQPLRSFEGWPR